MRMVERENSSNDAVFLSKRATPFSFFKIEKVFSQNCRNIKFVLWQLYKKEENRWRK